MSYVLGIDTSFEVAIGLACDGQRIDSMVVADTRAHAEELLPSIQELCQRHGLTLAGLSAVAVGMGPGPFTGLRVGIVTAWTIASLRGTQPHGVCSLDVIARQWILDGAPEEFVIASDARRKELYWARYREGIRVEGPCVTGPVDLPDLPWAGPVLDLPVGAVDLEADLSGVLALKAEIGHPVTYTSTHAAIPAARPPSGGRPTRLDAGVLAAEWEGFPAVSEPMYLRAADATVSTRKKSALPRITTRRR